MLIDTSPLSKTKQELLETCYYAIQCIDDTKVTDNNEFVIDNSIVKNELPQNNTINNNVNNNPNIAWSVPNIINQNNNPQNIQGNIPNPNMYTNQSIPRPININNISNR